MQLGLEGGVTLFFTDGFTGVCMDFERGRVWMLLHATIDYLRGKGRGWNWKGREGRDFERGLSRNLSQKFGKKGRWTEEVWFGFRDLLFL